MKLTVIIVNYNVRHYVAQCITSVERAIKVMRSKGYSAEVYVVDNHSRDDSVTYLRQHFPNVKVAASHRNLGFSKGNNIALRETQSEYVLLLNPDTVIGENTLVDVIDYVESHNDVGSIGVRMLNSDGSQAPESRRGLPTPMTSLYKILGLCRRYPDHPRYARYYMGGMSWDKPGEIDICSGAFMLLRRKAIDSVGFLDEDFFMYGEDIDLSYRIQKDGWKNVYYPTTILHYKGESTHKSSFRYVHVFYQAMLIFYRKHFRSAWWLSLPVRMAVYMKALLAVFVIMIERMKDAVGIFRERSNDNIVYHFFTSGKSLDVCRHIAYVNDLNAEYHLSDDASLTHESFTCELKRKQWVCFVYDTEAYSYERILDIMRKNSCKQSFIGFFHPDTRTVITPHDIHEYSLGEQ